MFRRTMMAVVLAVTLGAVAGCVGAISAPTLTPKVTPPTIGRAGVLRVAVDLSYPPFAGTVKGEKVGLDVDVAAAVADQLGLKLQLIDAKPAAAAALVTSGSVDMVLGALTVDEAVSTNLAFAGTYMSDAPAVFAAKDATFPLDAIGAKRIAVQNGTYAYWALLSQYGEAPLVIVPTLDQAFKDVRTGTADVAAGDALLGAYMLRGYPNLKYLGQAGSAYPLGVGVSQGDPKLEDEVRSVLDKLATQGVLQTLRRKWVGDLPPLKVTDASASGDASATVDTSLTP
jgi:polar amino acid transport system substrate-binding protein